MLTWLTRIAAGVFVVVAVAFVVNGLVLKQWQFWASAVGFSLVAGGWILLGNHWREDNSAWSANYEATKDLPEATGDDIVWADAVIFGSPTRYANVTGSFQSFIDTLGGLWAEGKLANKAYAAYTSSQTLHGGQETTLQHIYHMVMHFGGVIVAPGYTDGLKFVDGNPYGVSHVTGAENQNELDQSTIDALEHMTKRVIEIGGKLAD